MKSDRTTDRMTRTIGRDATIVRRMTAALRDFGYAGLTEAQVAEQFASVMAGDQPANIIAKFIKSWVDSARDMLEEKAQHAAPEGADLEE